MTEVSENDILVRVRAQVMCRDGDTGGWVPYGGGSLADVLVGRRERPRPPHAERHTRYPAVTTGESSGGNNSSSSANAPAYDYFIHGRRISDGLMVLECTIQKDFLYYKVVPTFHHWVTEEKRFGLTFQTAADARAFDKGVRTACEDILAGLDGAWSSVHAYRSNNRHKEEDEENNIFECLHLPSDSHSSSENSTASRPRRADVQTPILAAITLPSRHQRPQGQQGEGHSRWSNMSAKTPDLPNSGKSPVPSSGMQKELHCPNAEPMVKQQDVMYGGDKSEESDSDRCPYVHLSAVHEYTYPQVSPEGVVSPERPDQTNPPLMRRDSGSLKKAPPPVPDKKPTPETTFQARLKCRHCHEWYLESANRAGACEYAPDCFRTCIDRVSCIKCAQGMLYHCMADAEGDFVMHPCACGPPDQACTKRWVGITLLSLLVPCLWCYLPLRCVHRSARALRLTGGLHAPHQ